MVFPADTFEEAVDLSITASNQLHTILNGDSTTEVAVEDGSKIPSVRKAYTDSLFFLSPQPWVVGGYETVYNQLRAFVEPTGITTWWFSKTATVSTPTLMTTTPHDDTNWTLWNAINNSIYETQKRLAAEAGFNMVGSFLLGATVTTTDDVVFYETDGKYYGWGGTLPKIVPAGSTPATSGGIGAGAWSDKTGLTLRAELQNWRDDHLLLEDYLTLDGVTDNTSELNTLIKLAIDTDVGIDLGSGGYTARVKNAFLNDYTIGPATTGQREHVKAFEGRGGKYLAPLFKATDSATPSDYVLIGNNSVGVKVGGFRVHGNDISKGVDLSFYGDAGGVAPSNGNEISNIWCENFVVVGVNLDQCHDSDIHGIFTRNGGTTTSSVAVSLQGGGGFMAMRDSVIYGGRLRMSCQNGQLSNIIMSGLELAGSSYNDIVINACHFIAMESYAIKSTAIGNGSRSITLNSCYFPSTLGSDGYIQGHFWRGGVLTGCHFTSGVITQNISAASGVGAKPIFFFYNCTFETTPVFDTTNSIAVCVNCTDPTGALFNYQSEAINGYSWLLGLSIGSALKDSTESFANTAAGWTRFAANVAGVTPQNAFGVYFGWNKSAGRGETAIAYNKGAGSAAGIDFADTSTGTYVPQWYMNNASFGPANDNTQTAGLPSLRYSVVYAGTGTINTSDERLKTFLSITDREKEAANQIKSIISKFQFNDAIVVKGEKARYHFGVGAQSVKKILEDNGLEPSMYAFLCYDEWEAEYEPVMKEVVDCDGNISYEETGETRCVLEAGNRYGVRYDELAMFIMLSI